MKKNEINQLSVNIKIQSFDFERIAIISIDILNSVKTEISKKSILEMMKKNIKQNGYNAIFIPMSSPQNENVYRELYQKYFKCL